VYAYVEPLSLGLEQSTNPEDKKAKGMHTGKVKALENLIKGEMRKLIKDQMTDKG